MSDRSVASFPPSLAAAVTTRPATARPLGARTRFIAIAGGFCAYAALTAAAMVRVKEPSAQMT